MRPRVNLQQLGASTLVEAGGARLPFECCRGATLRLAQAGVPVGSVARFRVISSVTSSRTRFRDARVDEQHVDTAERGSNLLHRTPDVSHAKLPCEYTLASDY